MNPNVNDDNKYLILLDEEGNRADTRLACEYTDETIESFIANGYIVVSEEKFSLIIGNDPDGKMWDLQPDGSLKERPPYVPSIEELQEAKLNEAGAEFAKRRDAIRWVQVSDGNAYGFDCASEDITNFMAAWKAAETDGHTGYKVWFTETTKGLVVLQEADFKTVFDFVRNSQLEAYAWYEELSARIRATTTAEELDAITW